MSEFADMRFHLHRRCGPVNWRVPSLNFHFCETCSEYDDEGVTFAQWPCAVARALGIPKPPGPTLYARDGAQ